MYAIVESGGKQFRVQEGDVIRVEKLKAGAGSAVVFDRVLAVARDGNLTVGSPFVAGAKVSGTVERESRGRKILVFKYHNKTNYRRRQGHRQPFTQVKIEKIEA